MTVGGRPKLLGRSTNLSWTAPTQTLLPAEVLSVLEDGYTVGDAMYRAYSPFSDRYEVNRILRACLEAKLCQEVPSPRRKKA